MIEVIYLVLLSSIRMSVALAFTTLGAVYSTRVGVSELGCEGMMIGGSFFGVIGSFYFGSAWIGLLCAIAAGVFFALLHGVLHISFRVNASISGVSVNLLSASLAPLFLQLIWHNKSMSPAVSAFSSVNLDWLKKIPVVGEILNAQTPLFYILIVLVVIAYIHLYKTKSGLRLRMVGENPSAASTVGIRTVAYKYFGVLICGALTGIGGACLSLGQMNMYTVGITAGKGYIAMVINALGRYNPIGALIGSIFFSLFEAIRTTIQNDAINQNILRMLPYVTTLIVIVFVTRNVRRPAGIGKHHDD